MKFEDIDLKPLDLTIIDNFVKVFIEFLCGKEYSEEIINNAKKKILEKNIQDINIDGLNYIQFNEILLLLNQNRVTQGFYEYFFGKERLNFEELKSGIEKFRGYSLLHFGNFRFTFKLLSEKTKEELKKILDIYKEIDLDKEFRTRKTSIHDVNKIDKNKTCFLGYITGQKLTNELDFLREEIEKLSEKEDFEESKDYMEYQKFYNELKKKNDEIQKIQQDGLTNTLSYLISSYLDVYIATSMREVCEYEEIFEFLQIIMNDKQISKLNLQFFDPTQSFCENPRDKGLIEGLMLKRAKCTIYMVQESDTIGKDSELASTLAQKKPVIAYVPNDPLEKLIDKIKEYPLDYIKKRILNFKAEGIFSKPEFTSQINELSLGDKTEFLNLQKFLLNFVEKLDEHRINQPYTFWEPKEQHFIDKNKEDFEKICKILAIATKIYWDHRAKVLKEFHPLAMQIDINTGVAIGVIVCRKPKTCINILIAILANKLNFKIKREDDYTGLFETTTDSIYRIITHDNDLTNSFWNYFYEK